MLAIALAILVLYLVYHYGTRNFSYWSEKGVKHDKPLPVFGNALRKFLLRISLTEVYSEAYSKYPNERFVGLYMASNRQLILRDPDLIKDVLVTDFHHFSSRGLLPPENVLEPVFRNLFFAEGDLWKLLRQRQTAAFTSGKLKAMFPLIVKTAEKLESIVLAAAETGEEVDVRDLMARYTTDFIGACGFGIDIDSLNDENSIFRRLGKRIFAKTKRDGFIGMLKFVAPSFFKNLHFMAPEIEHNGRALVRSILEERDQKPSGRNDFIDLLLELKQKGKLVGESVEIMKADGTPEMAELELDELLITAQALLFFVAGFETSSSTTSYMLHQLAFHPEAQEKCHREIDEVLSRHGKLSYEAVKEMKYLEMCFREGMRMFPSLGFLVRRCVRPYQLPGTDVVIDDGVSVVVPLQALQNDQKYFEEPSQFRPERFSPENASKIPNHVYLPFGEGPRACIGERLGLMQSLAGLAAVLRRARVSAGARAQPAPAPHPAGTITQNVRGGLPLLLHARNTNVTN